MIKTLIKLKVLKFILIGGVSAAYTFKKYCDQKNKEKVKQWNRNHCNQNKERIRERANRNHKKYPVKADFKGISLSTSTKEHVEVVFDKNQRIAYLM